MSGPLAGLRVLDLGTRIAAPFCAGLLGEQGADVIKIEQPRGGDFMREIGPFVDAGDDGQYSLFWAVEGRGRKSVTLDLRALFFMGALVLVTGVLFGIAPALQVMRVNAADSLKEGSRSSTTGAAG